MKLALTTAGPPKELLLASELSADTADPSAYADDGSFFFAVTPPYGRHGSRADSFSRNAFSRGCINFVIVMVFALNSAMRPQQATLGSTQCTSPH
jgi:hypothetical protein